MSKCISSENPSENLLENEKYVCECCQYTTNKKTNFNEHLKTQKHNNNVFGGDTDKLLNCMYCDKKYHTKQALWYHKKKCLFNLNLENPPCKEEEEITIQKDVFYKILSQNQDIQNKFIEHFEKKNEDNKEIQQFFMENNNKLVDIIKNMNVTNNMKMTNNSHNNTTNNNHFNLNFFLNEQCKNAVNMTDFINSVQIELEDVTKVGKEGFVDGITHIIMKNMNKLDIFNRPIHCSDLKRDVLHIREDNQWKKETDNKTIKNCVDKIAMKNCQKIARWQEVNEESKIKDSPSYNLWLEIIGQSMNTGEKGERNTERVIKNISKNVIIDKA